MNSKYYIAVTISVSLLLVLTASNVGSWMVPAFAQQSTGAICPSKNIQQWEKIDFIILSPDVAKKLNVNANTD